MCEVLHLVWIGIDCMTQAIHAWLASIQYITSPSIPDHLLNHLDHSHMLGGVHMNDASLQQTSAQCGVSLYACIMPHMYT